MFSLLYGSITLAHTIEKDSLADTNKPIFVKSKSPSFTIALKANRTTGYEWLYDLDHSSNGFIESTHSLYLPAKKTSMGAAGQNYFKFTLKPRAFEVPSVLKITLIYARPWEMEDPAETLELKIITDNQP
jgi:predicted secreted protein